MSWIEYPDIPRCRVEAHKGAGVIKICNEPLDNRGRCPIADRHVEQIDLPLEPYMPVYDEEAAQRLLKAIEDPTYHAILDWEAEGGSL